MKPTNLTIQKLSTDWKTKFPNIHLQ